LTSCDVPNIIIYTTKQSLSNIILAFRLGGTEKIMDGYITAKEAAKKWNVSDRQVQVWCQTGMLEGIAKFGSSWAIPVTAEKPTRTGKYKPGRKPKNT
jgi:hypothetical protein